MRNYKFRTEQDSLVVWHANQYKIYGDIALVSLGFQPVGVRMGRGKRSLNNVQIITNTNKKHTAIKVENQIKPES